MADEVKKPEPYRAPGRGGRPVGSGKKGKANMETSQEYLLEVSRRLARMQPVREICAELMPLWGLSYDGVYYYIEEARKLIRRDFEREKVDAGVMLREAMIDLHNAAYRSGDYRTCATILANLAKLLGANAPEKAMVATGTVGSGVIATAVIGPSAPDATRARIGELLGDPEWYLRVRGDVKKE